MSSKLDEILCEHTALSASFFGLETRLETTPTDIRKEVLATQQLAAQEAELLTQTIDILRMQGRLEKIKQELRVRSQR